MRKLALLLLAFALCLPLLGSPISPCYLTAGNSQLNWIIQGDTAQSFSQHDGQEYPIAISGGQVRTASDPAISGNGSLYDLNFNYMGTDYSYPGSYLFYDGTSDGTYNYSVDYFTGIVYRMNLDWSSPVRLFDTGLQQGHSLGITYDPVNASLWVSEWNGRGVYDFGLDGTVLSSFGAAHSHSAITALAMDYADHTLWLGDQTDQGTFEQYSVTGALLQSQYYPSLVNQNTLGGEFSDEGSGVPEPASGLLLGCALAGLLMLRRRRG